MVKILDVEKNSRAEKAGIIPGDELMSINGNEIEDVLDYRFYLAEREVLIEWKREDKPFSAKIKKGEYDDIGLEFATALMDEKNSCRNACVFCFIDQNPVGLRETLYFKDDDSRLSFLHGNYITLTNMYDKDIERIVKMRFSPINISVHTTNPELRVKMMKNKRAGDVLKYLERFMEAGIQMCAQIVLCKGINDGAELLRTMQDLSKYYPTLQSVAIVPAGLTKFRDKLYPLTDFNASEAAAVIDMVEDFAKKHKEENESRLFHLADEFYLKASRPIPPSENYEDFQQLENGVGMLRLFFDEFGVACEDIIELSRKLTTERHVAVATGVAAYPMISEMSKQIMAMCERIKIDVYCIKNNFFGESITVSGLLTGSDFLEQLKGRLNCKTLLIPASTVRRNDEDFLCGMKLVELAEALDVSIRLCENDGYDFLSAVFGC